MALQGLEVEEDSSFSRKETVVERVAWAVMALFLVLALLGLFGRGLLSSAQTSGPRGTVTVEYQRFARYSAPADLWVSTGPAAVRDGEVVLTLSSRWADGVEIQRVVPQPDTWTSGPDGMRLVFPAEPDPPEVRISYRPETVGTQSGAVAVEGGPRIEFGQFVYF